MDAKFWKKAWTEGRTAFHRADVNEQLLKYFPRLAAKRGQKVLVPLCGKSKDLLYLRQQGLDVHGVELHEPAVQDFFAENKLNSPTITRDRDFSHYATDGLVISCGDFFSLSHARVYDLVYDRAALVALPPPMRKSYSEVIKRSLGGGGKGLLIAYEYDQALMDGPPFSVDAGEIRALYGDALAIEPLESERAAEEGSRLSALKDLKRTVYLLSK